MQGKMIRRRTMMRIIWGFFLMLATMTTWKMRKRITTVDKDLDVDMNMSMSMSMSRRALRVQISMTPRP